MLGQKLTSLDRGGIEYPIDQRAPAMYPVIMVSFCEAKPFTSHFFLKTILTTVNEQGKDYEVQVQHHKVNNITYVLLDAPVFRKCSKADPYPPRMDDMDSAVYYSAWNYCIAETMKRYDFKC